MMETFLIVGLVTFCFWAVIGVSVWALWPEIKTAIKDYKRKKAEPGQQ